ncbi:MAG TPA: carbohydrate kinase family protein [Candidatus Hydrogenedentes bacterium]|nr:carbohydrate kinase family protein [Candidatus Hydrogenedentota bacterium]
MAVDVICLGLACADVMVRPVEAFPPRGKLELVPTLEIHLGGLAGVAAAVIAKLGGSVGFMGKLGNDGFGDYCAGALQRFGVNTDHLARSADEGTPATVVLVGKDGERTFLHHPGCARTLREGDVNTEKFRGAKHVHWGGPAVTPGLDGPPIARILERAKNMGLTTSVDTCYDGVDVWFPRIEAALPYLDVVMSSLEEARKYTGKRDPEAIADFYLDRGPDIAVIKLGEDGMFVKSTVERLRVPAHKVEVVDTTGAGDAACGAFVYGYTQGWELARSVQLANAVGALTVQTMGGAEAVQSLEATLAFIERVPVKVEVV